MKTAIVTDTNSGITAQMAREMGIYLIPMPFFIDGSTYYEGETCTPDFFFRHLKAKAEVSTSQPSPEVITSLWASLLETHDAVLHFPMTAGLSGSCETAKALAQEFDGRVLVVDDTASLSPWPSPSATPRPCWPRARRPRRFGAS